jgi:hypothetical protein
MSTEFLRHVLTITPRIPTSIKTAPIATRGAFHWYAVHQASEPCVQVWVHACVPDERAPSMACE